MTAIDDGRPAGRRLSVWFVGIVSSGVLLYLAMRGVDLGRMWQTLISIRTATDWLLVLAAGVLSIAHLLLRAARWRLLVTPLVAVPVGRLFAVSWIGAALDNMLPARAGDVGRAALLRRDGIAGSAAFATIVVERVIDVLATQLLLFVALVVAPLPPWLWRLGILAMAGAGAVLFGLWLTLRHRSRVETWASGFAPMAEARLPRRLLDAFLNGASAALQAGHVPGLLGWSLMIHAANVSAALCVLAACGLVENLVVGLVLSVTLHTLIGFAMMVPAAPGQLGTLHYACVVALGLFAIDPSAAMGFALLYHATQYLPVTLGGWLLMAREGWSLRGRSNGSVS